MFFFPVYLLLQTKDHRGIASVMENHLEDQNQLDLLIRFYKELAYAVMEAEISQDWQTGDPREPMVYSTASLKAQNPTRAKISLCIWSSQKTDASAHAVRLEAFPLTQTSLFYSGHWLVSWGLSTLGRTICFTHMWISSSNTLKDTPRVKLNQISGHPVTLSSGHIQLTIAAMKNKCYMGHTRQCKLELLSTVSGLRTCWLESSLSMF